MTLDIHDIKQQLQTIAPKADNIPEPLLLPVEVPLQTLTDLENFESQINSDKSAKTNVVSKLSFHSALLQIENHLVIPQTRETKIYYTNAQICVPQPGCMSKVGLGVCQELRRPIGR